MCPFKSLSVTELLFQPTFKLMCFLERKMIATVVVLGVCGKKILWKSEMVVIWER